MAHPEEKNEESSQGADKDSSPDSTPASGADGVESEFNDFIFEEEGETTNDTVKKLRSKLKECTKEKREYLDGWQRAKADLINAKKKFAAEKKQAATRATERLVEDLLPVVDSFEMAFSADSWEDVDANWRTGVEHIHKELTRVLAESGVDEITPEVGDEFNAAEHESVESVDTDESDKDNLIATVERKGYRIGDRVIRSARVSTYKYEE